MVLRSFGVLAIVPMVVLGTLAAPRVSAACSCVDWPAERQMAEADQVFVGRYVRPGPDEDGTKLRFDVIESLKGEVGHRFEIPRPPDSDCERSFQNKELAIVFVAKNRVPVCGGNVDIDKALPSLGDYLTLAGRAQPAPSLAAMKVALAGRLGSARKLKVYAPTLKGKTVSIDSTQVSFTDSNGEDLPAASGVTSSVISYVVLRAHHFATYLMIAPVQGKLQIVYSLKRDLTLR
jgi:hypothetical protein